MQSGSLAAVNPPELDPSSAAGVIAQNTAAQIAARVVTMLASLIAIPILTRYLGPTLFGEYSLVLTFNALLLTITDLGIQTIATRDAAQHPDQAEVLAAQTVLLRTAATVVLGGLSVAVLWLTGYPATVKTGFAILAPTVLFNALGGGFAVILQAGLRLYVLAFADMLGKLLTASMLIAAVVIATHKQVPVATGLTAIFGVTLLAGVVPLLVSGLAVRRWGLLRIRMEGKQVMRLLKDSLPFGAVVVTSLLIYRVDTVILSILRGPYDVGIYNVAYRFQDFILVLPATLMAVAFPVMSTQIATPGTFRRSWQSALNTLALTGVPISLGIIVTAPQLIALFGGPAFGAAVLPLQVLSVAVLLSYLNYAFAYPLVIAGRQRIFLLVNLFGVLLNVGLNLVFIPTYSYNAAAGISAVSELVSLLLAYAVAIKAYGYSLSFTIVLKAAIAGAVMMGLLYPVRTMSLAALIPLGLVIYGAAVLLLRALEPSIFADLMRRGKAPRYSRPGSRKDFE